MHRLVLQARVQPPHHRVDTNTRGPSPDRPQHFHHQYSLPSGPSPDTQPGYRPPCIHRDIPVHGAYRNRPKQSGEGGAICYQCEPVILPMLVMTLPMPPLPLLMLLAPGTKGWLSFGEGHPPGGGEQTDNEQKRENQTLVPSIRTDTFTAHMP
jgi:hypothetical protein